MPRKTIICRCEDVTEHEIRKTIEQGFRDIESLKRYAAVCTGPCQSKHCLASVARILSEYLKEGDPPIAPIVPRPPLFPTELVLFAGKDPEEPEK